MAKPWIYIASPYTKGDVAINVKASYDMYHQLMDTGLVNAFTPLTSHALHLHRPRSYQEWIDYDLEIIPRMDACIRIGASDAALGYWQWESKGADGEVALFRSLGRPVFVSVAEVVAWAKEWHKNNPDLGAKAVQRATA